MAGTGEYGKAIGDFNLMRTRRMLINYPGIKQTEIAKALDLSPMTVHYHIKRIRATWPANPPDEFTA